MSIFERNSEKADGAGAVRREKRVKARYGVSWQFYLLNTGFIIVMAVIIVLVVNFIFANITETASEEYAYLYSQDASGKLNTYLNHEIELVRQSATSPKLIEWFADEGNLEKKGAAVDEMIVLGGLYYSTELYFVIHESLNEYSIDVTDGAIIEDFEPFDVIDPDIEYNQWYFRAIESENAYSLNIDIDKVTNQRRLWINYKVEQEGKPVGVFCSGLRFDDIFYDLFSQYGGGRVTSYIINEYGILQMDSNFPQDGDYLIGDENIHIREVSPDPAFLDAIEEHLSGDGGFFSDEDEPVVLILPSDRGTYVSIAPITGTNWTVVTFFNSEQLFSTSRLQPLLITVLIALALYSIVVVVLSNRLFFAPFRKLLSGFNKVVIEDGENSRASSLQNEFGEVFNTLEYIRLMLNSVPVCCILWDEDYHIISCNHEALFLHGMKDSIELERRFGELSPELQPDGKRSAEERVAILKRGFDEGYCRAHWMHQTSAGEPLPCEITCIRLRHKDEYVLAAYTRDLREQNKYIEQIENAREKLRLALGEAEAANRAKSQFLANMSHEIRTPMNAILGIAEIQLQNKDVPEGYKEAFENIFDSGDLLLGIINDILDLSKIEEGKLDIIRSPYNVPNMIHDVSALNHLRYENKPIEFIIDLDEGTPRELVGDELRIKQILNNLLSNAFKYTERGVVEFKVWAETANNSENKNGKSDDYSQLAIDNFQFIEDVELVFTVRDTGQGLSEEQIDKLFDEYTRFNLDINRSISGTGLGLSIARRLIDMMGGKISIDSMLGEGTTFTVRLPQESTGLETCGAEIVAELHDFRYRSGMKRAKSKLKRKNMAYGKVLIVDDVRSNLYVAKGLLMPYGLQIEEATNGLEAIDKIKEGNTYDLILMDHMMPKMNGIKATEHIRKLGYEAPIVALTANAFVGQEEMFLNNGFDGYISKPIDSRELDSLLNKFIAGA